MHIRGIVVTLLCSLVAAPLLVPGSAGAVPVEVGQHTIFDTRVAGMPAATEAYRTLRSVSGETDWRTGEVVLTAVLGGTAPAFIPLSVTWNLGRWSPSGTECTPEKTITSSITGDGTTTTISATRIYGDLAHDYTCLDVSLTSQGAVSDRMRDGWVDRVAYSGAEADLVSSSLGGVVPTTVLAGRPTKALLLVTSHVLPSSSTTVTGSGPVAVGPVTVAGLAADEVRPVVARLTAPRKGRFAVDLAARDERGDADYDGTSKVKAVRVTGRPDAGTYTDDDVRFRVDGAGRVRSLVASASSCGTTASTSTRIRLRDVVRLPRTGATAVAQRTGAGWTAVQLVTVAERRVTGVVVRSTPDCLQVVSFAARRTR